MIRIPRNPVWKSVWLLMATIAVASFAHAQVAPAAAPVIGSGNTATADPPVPHPHTKPCVVALFKNQEFADYSAKTFTYTPPDNCAGPWAKVIFVGDFNVTEGIQFDRTAAIYVGHVNVYYGTTPEPDPSLGPNLACRARHHRLQRSANATAVRRSRHLQHREFHLHRHHFRHRKNRVLSS